MFKKLICYAITVSLIFQGGCYSSEIISRDNYNSLDEYEGKLFVMMKNGSLLKFLEKELKITRDTLYIISHLKILRSGRIIQPGPPFKIPIEDSAYFEIQEFNLGKTFLLGSGIGIVLWLIVVFVLFLNAAYSGMWKGYNKLIKRSYQLTQIIIKYKFSLELTPNRNSTFNYF